MGKLLNELFSYRSDNLDSMIYEELLKSKFPKNIIRIPNIRYSEKSRRNLLDIYRPSNTISALPLIIYVHGGGLVAGNKEMGAHFCADITAQGFTVCAIEYDKAPDVSVSDQMEEISRAIDFVVMNRSSFGIDLSRVYIAGDDAGAFLITYILAAQKDIRVAHDFGFTPPKQRIDAVIFISGLFCLSRQNKIGSIFGNIALNKKCKKSRFLDPACDAVIKSLPICYFISGESDELLPHTNYMVKAMDSIGADYEMCIFHKDDRLKTDFPIMKPAYKESKDTVAFIVSFLRKQKAGGGKYEKCG